MSILKRFKRKGLFGSKVIGKERALLEAKHIKERRSRFGPRVLGAEGAIPGTNTPRSKQPLDVAHLSVADMTAILERNPAYYSVIYNAEFERFATGGIRREAVQLLLKHVAAGIENKVERKRAELRLQAFLETGRDVASEKIAEREGAHRARLARLKDTLTQREYLAGEKAKPKKGELPEIEPVDEDAETDGTPEPMADGEEDEDDAP